MGLKDRDFSTEMSRVAGIFYDYDGGELGQEMETWMYNFIGELEKYAKPYKVYIGREINGKHVLLVANMDARDYEYHKGGLGQLGYQMFSGISEDEEDFKQVILGHLKKSRLGEVTEQDWSEIAQSLRNGLHYIENYLSTKLANVDVVMNNIEHKIKTEALSQCVEYMLPFVKEYYDKAVSLYEKLSELKPQDDYIHKISETPFVDGFDTFYKFMVTDARTIHVVLIIINNLKTNIALAESEY